MDVYAGNKHSKAKAVLDFLNSGHQLPRVNLPSRAALLRLPGTIIDP